MDSTGIQLFELLKSIHIGEQLNFHFEHSNGRFTKSGLTRHLGYKDRNSVYNLISAHSWKLDQLYKVSSYFRMSVPEFLRLDQYPQLQITSQSDKKEYIEDRVSEVEKSLKIVLAELHQLKGE